MIRAGDEAHEVRHDEADEPDHAGRGYRQRRRQGRRREEDMTDVPDRQADDGRAQVGEARLAPARVEERLVVPLPAAAVRQRQYRRGETDLAGEVEEAVLTTER